MLRYILVAAAVIAVAIIGLLLSRVFARADMLQPGADAPDISGQSVLDGKTQPFSLKDQLKQGAVVLYFFPAAFTAG